MPELVWHYTTFERLLKILDAGAITPSLLYVPETERPIVWFTFNPDWEETANQMMRNDDGSLMGLDREQTAKLGGALVRIGVHPDTAPYDWKTLKELSGMTSRVAQGLYRAAIQVRSRPGQWRGTFDVVPSDKWVSIQIFRHGQWEELKLQQERDGVWANVEIPTQRARTE